MRALCVHQEDDDENRKAADSLFGKELAAALEWWRRRDSLRPGTGFRAQGKLTLRVLIPLGTCKEEIGAPLRMPLLFMVEAAGFEPASGNRDPTALHA